ncbi:MAG: RNA 2',3'-cyclic phosphodiesterase [Candidatus Cloacimonetes bacterium]|nr:RNA 2',3'-cyclic phosphodiesterase [Candidatus Cloacimonadota bacterium]
MRAFIALELPSPIRKQLATVSQQLQQYDQRFVNWVEPQNLHITFQFLGDISASHLPDIEQIITENCADLNTLQLSLPVLQLVPAAKPRVLWVNYQSKSNDLIKAQHRMNDAIASLGYKLDRKPLVFHVTLARIKAALQPALIDTVMKYKINHTSFSPDKLTLFKSILKPQGPIYQPLFSLTL